MQNLFNDYLGETGKAEQGEKIGKNYEIINMQG